MYTWLGLFKLFASTSLIIKYQQRETKGLNLQILTLHIFTCVLTLHKSLPHEDGSTLKPFGTDIIYFAKLKSGEKQAILGLYNFSGSINVCKVQTRQTWGKSSSKDQHIFILIVYKPIYEA